MLTVVAIHFDRDDHSSLVETAAAERRLIPVGFVHTIELVFEFRDSL
jgi:hypothetical protein